MQLNFQERVVLLSLLPEKEDYVGMKEVRRARESLAISGEEAKKYGDKMEDGNYNIDFRKTANIFVDIPFGEWLTEKIRTILRLLDEKHQLEERHMSLFEKFVANYNQY